MKSYKDFVSHYKLSLKKGERFDLKEVGKRWQQYKLDQSIKSLPKVSDSKPVLKPVSDVVDLDIVKLDMVVSEPIHAPISPISVSKLDVAIEQPSNGGVDHYVPQASSIQAQTSPIQQVVKTPFVPDERYFSLEDLEQLAAAVHETLANLVHLANPSISIDTGSIARLNRFGAKLLHKYDTNGLLEKYGLEIAYGFTLLGTVLNVVMVIQIQKEAKKASDGLK